MKCITGIFQLGRDILRTMNAADENIVIEGADTNECFT
jgi:hypothetical protein